jgi:hypothetical protein
VTELFPLPTLPGVGDRYRERRKKVSPGEDLLLHVINHDLREMAPDLRPIAAKASTGETPTRDDPGGYCQCHSRLVAPEKHRLRAVAYLADFRSSRASSSHSRDV